MSKTPLEEFDEAIVELDASLELWAKCGGFMAESAEGDAVREAVENILRTLTALPARDFFASVMMNEKYKRPLRELHYYSSIIIGFEQHTGSTRVPELYKEKKNDAELRKYANLL